VHHTW